jgi:Mg2+/Co2+ transporter CorB
VELTTLFLILLGLIVFAGFFASAEIGMMSLNRYRLRHLVKKKNKQAIRVSQMLAHPDRLLSVVLIGNTLANIVGSTVATIIGQQLYGEIGIAVATALLTLIILIFSEMAPKTFAAIYPQQVAFACSLPLKILQTIFLPLVNLISWVTNVILRLMGISMDKTQKDALTGEELRSVVHEAGGLLPIEHKSMLISLIDLEQARVEDIMVPKSDIVGINLDQPWHELLKQLEMTQHTRLPLYRDSIDNLVGMIHLRSVLNLSLEGRLDMDNLLKIAETPYFIPEGTSLSLQILNFQKMKRRSCFVVDEYGSLLGLVTLNDLLEAIVGDLPQHDMQDYEIVKRDDGSYLVDAQIPFYDFLTRFDKADWMNEGEQEFDTLAGFILHELERIPATGEKFEWKGFSFEIKEKKLLERRLLILLLFKYP